jgi:hypothetical protein
MSRSFRFGLVVLGVLSLFDLAGPLLTDGDHPPMGVALTDAVLGLVSLVCVWLVWRGERRAVPPLVVLRLLSAASVAPAFFVDDVPGPVKALAGGIVLLTLVAVAMMLGRRAQGTATA